MKKTLASIKKGCTFAAVKAFTSWSGSSAWLECLPVTQEVASSSLVRTARAQVNKDLRSFRL